MRLARPSESDRSVPGGLQAANVWRDGFEGNELLSQGRQGRPEWLPNGARDKVFFCETLFQPTIWKTWRQRMPSD
jgi:hypothetical protein